MTEYQKLLRDPRWQRKRLEVMQRDHWKCACCSDGESELNVHHIQYRQGAKPWEYDDSLLITLCRRCHEAVHAGEPISIYAPPPPQNWEKIQGVAVSWISHEAEGYNAYEFIPWTGKRLRENHHERNVIFVCLDKKGNEFHVSSGTARAFEFPSGTEYDQFDCAPHARPSTNQELFYWFKMIQEIVRDGLLQSIEL